ALTIVPFDRFWRSFSGSWHTCAPDLQRAAVSAGNRPAKHRQNGFRVDAARTLFSLGEPSMDHPTNPPEPPEPPRDLRKQDGASGHLKDLYERLSRTFGQR